MAKKKVHRPKKAKAQRPRRRPLGRGSGPVVDEHGHEGGHWHDDGTWHGAAHGDELGLDPESAQERELRLALIAEVEAIDLGAADAALLANPLVARLVALFAEGAVADEEPVLVPPRPGTEPLDDDAVARLRRWSAAGLHSDHPERAAELRQAWAEGDQAGVASSLLTGYLAAVVSGEGVDESLDWLGIVAAAGRGEEPPGDREAAMSALQDYARGEMLVDLLGRLALTSAVDVTDTVLSDLAELDAAAGGLVTRDVQLLAAAGFVTLDGVVAAIEPNLRRLLLVIADVLVEHLSDGADGADLNDGEE